MILEYHFAALRYDEQAHELHCAACGEAVEERRVMFRAGGRWVCGRCLPRTDVPPTESILCSTLKAAAEK